MYVLYPRQFLGGKSSSYSTKASVPQNTSRKVQSREGNKCKYIRILVQKFYFDFAESAWSELPSMTFLPEDDPRWRHCGVPGKHLMQFFATLYYYCISNFQGAKVLSAMCGSNPSNLFNFELLDLVHQTYHLSIVVERDCQIQYQLCQGIFSGYN